MVFPVPEHRPAAARLPYPLNLPRAPVVAAPPSLGPFSPRRQLGSAERPAGAGWARLLDKAPPPTYASSVVVGG